jgi:hypothetical protein
MPSRLRRCKGTAFSRTTKLFTDFFLIIFFHHSSRTLYYIQVSDYIQVLDFPMGFILKKSKSLQLSARLFRRNKKTKYLCALL